MEGKEINFFAENKIDFNECDNYHRNSMHFACLNPHLDKEMLSSLLLNGAFEIKDAKELTPFRLLVEKFHHKTSLIKFFAKKGGIFIFIYFYFIFIYFYWFIFV
jgi:hypothetical protein